MNVNENAKTTMYSGYKALLDKSSSIYSANIGFLDQKTLFDTTYADLIAKAGNVGINLTGFTDNKDIAKEQLAEQTSDLCGFAFIKLESLGLHDISEQLLINPTDYVRLTDSQAGITAKKMYKLMNDNQLLITDDYVTVAQLTALLAAITAFITSKGTTTQLHKTSPADTKAFKDAFEPVDNAIFGALTMGKAFRTSQPVFYADLVAVTKLPPIIPHHTPLEITVIDKSNKQSVITAKAETQLPKNIRTEIADSAGIIIFTTIRQGVQTITVSAPGYKSVTFQITILRGQDNAITIELEAA